MSVAFHRLRVNCVTPSALAIRRACRGEQPNRSARAEVLTALVCFDPAAVSVRDLLTATSADIADMAASRIVSVSWISSGRMSSPLRRRRA